MQLENLVPSFMRKIFRHGVPYAFMGDGSSDSSMAEVEDTEFCMIGPGGKPRLHFGDLDELDLSQSKDGKSPDAQCIFASYKKTQQRLQLPESEVCTHQPRVSHNYFEGSSACKNIIFNNKAEDALVCQNLDGASVNQGENEGVAAHTARWAEQSTTTHSVAHVNQICTGHAFEEDPYYFEFRRIVMPLSRTIVKVARNGRHSNRSLHYCVLGLSCCFWSHYMAFGGWRQPVGLC